MHTPPITQLGMEFTTATNGVRNEITIARIAVVIIVMIDALPVTATQAMLSP